MRRRAQVWDDRLDVGGAQRPSQDHREARRRARRREHQEVQRVRPSPQPVRGVVGRRLCRLRLRRPAGGQRCTMRRSTAAPNPPWCCSSAAPTRPSRTTKGNAVLPRATPTGPPTESARIGAGERLAKKHNITTCSPRTTRRWRRCGRRHRPRAPPSACKPCHATSRTQHCTDRALRNTPTHPRNDVRVALRAIRWCRWRAAGPAGT